MPSAGWRYNSALGLWINTGAEADPMMEERQGYLGFDPSTLSTGFLPWADGSGQYIRQRPILPANTSLGTPVEITGGYEWPCTAGPIDKIQVVDLQLTKWGTYLDGFAGQGLKMIWWGGVSLIKDDGGGWWRPKRTEITGTVRACPQPLVVPEGSEAKRWALGSIAYYGEDHKTNNRNHPNGTKTCYHTGKLWHSPAPLAVFWNAAGQYLGYVVGKLEWDAANAHEVKAYPLADCMAFVNGGATKVSIDLTLGYTSNGAYAQGSGSEINAVRLGPPVGVNATVDSCHWLWYSVSLSYAMFGIYNDEAYTPPDSTLVYKPTSLVADSGIINFAVGSYYNWKREDYGATKPSLVSGNAYWLSVQAYADAAAAVFCLYDNDASTDGDGRKIWCTDDKSTAANRTTLYDPWNLNWPANRKGSAYLTYTEAASGQPAMRRRPWFSTHNRVN